MKAKYLSLLLVLLTCGVVFGQNNNAYWQQQQQQQQQQRMLDQQRMDQQRRMQEQQRIEQQRRMEELQRQRAQQMELQRRQQQEAMQRQQEAARRQQQLQQQQMRERQMADQRQRQTAQVQQRMQAARTNTINQQRRNIAASILKQKQVPIASRQTAPAARGKSAPQVKSASLKASVKASVDKARLAITQKRTVQVKQEAVQMREIKRLQSKTQMLRAKLQTLIKTQQAQAKAAAKSAIAKMKGLSALRAKAKEVPPAQAKPKPKGEICFVAGTLVKTITGLVPIEDIRVGDLVWSRDDQTGDEGWKPVVQLFTTYPTELVHLSYTIEGNPQLQVLTGTAIHPFWSEDRKQWVDMGDLDINETLSLDDANRYATVLRVEREIAPTGEFFTTFNFEVAGWHTYFVAPKNSPPTEAGIWVHNTSDSKCSAESTRAYHKLKAKILAHLHKAPGKISNSQSRNHDSIIAKKKNKPGPTLPPDKVLTFRQGIYQNRQVSGDEVFYRYHGKDNRTGKPVSYVTNKKYKNENELRNDLAILKEWAKYVKIDRVTTFKPSKGTWVSEGYAAPQAGVETSETRPGGGYQAIINSNNLSNSTILRTDSLEW